MRAGEETRGRESGWVKEGGGWRCSGSREGKQVRVVSESWVSTEPGGVRAKLRPTVRKVDGSFGGGQIPPRGWVKS